MAKKKSKKNSFGNIIIASVALALGIASLCMMFLNCVSISEDVAFTGTQFAFGYSVKVFGEVLTFNFVALLAFVLPVVGGLLCFFDKNFLVKIISIACFVAGAVLFFLMGQIFSIGIGEKFTALYNFFASNDAIKASISIGAIVGGILSALGAVIVLFKSYIVKFIK